MVTVYRRSFVLVALFAMWSGTALAAVAIAQSYKPTIAILDGTLVSLADAGTQTVEPASTDNVTKLIGVSVHSESTSVAVNESSDSVLVAQSGTTAVIVSDINGAIKAGDAVTASPLIGVGMKATSDVKIIGHAESDMSLTGSVNDITDKSGKHVKVHTARVPVILQLSDFTPSSTGLGAFVPPAIQKFANSVAGGRQVELWRVLLSFILATVTTIIIVTLVISGIQTSLRAIGRNPLSAPAVYRTLLQLIVMTVGLLILTIGADYLLLAT